MSDKMYLTFELGLNKGRMVQVSSGIYSEPKKSFKKVVEQILEENPHAAESNKQLKIDEVVVFVNRSPFTPFFPIGANQKQIRHFEESKLDPPHEEIPEADLKLSTKKITEKYNVHVFTLYLKQ